MTLDFLPASSRHKELPLGTLSGESAPHLRGLWAVIADHSLDGLAEGIALALQKAGVWQEQEFGGVGKALFERLVILSMLSWGEILR